MRAGAALALLILGAAPALGQDSSSRKYYYEDIFTPFFAKDEAAGLYRAQRPGSRPTRPAEGGPTSEAEFPARKAKDSLRVFVLGGSIALNYMTALDNIGNALRSALPTRRIEALNCGMAGYDSAREALVLEEVLGYEPDLIVLLTGHNDALDSLPVPLWLLHAGDRLRRIEAFRLLVDKLKPPSDFSAQRQREKALRRDERFERNVWDMLRHAAKKGVPMLVAIPPLNYRESPPGLPFSFYNLALNKGWLSFLRGDDAAALAAWRPALAAMRAEEGSVERAHLLFLMASAQDRAGRKEEAASLYRRSVEADWVNGGRCRPACQDALRRAASQEGAIEADLDALFWAKSAPDAPGLDLFSDHVHWLRDYDKGVSLELIRALRRDPRFQALPWDERAIKELESRWAAQKRAPNEAETVGTLRYAVTRADRGDKALSWTAVSYLAGVRRAYPGWLSDISSIAARAEAGSGLYAGRIWGQAPVKARLAPLEWHLGELDLRQGRLPEARARFDAALDADPSLTRVLLHRAIAQWLSGNAAGARDSLRQAQTRNVYDAGNLALAMGLSPDR